jgi:hypothetical protein
MVESLVFSGIGRAGLAGPDGIFMSADAEAFKHKRPVE